MNIEKIYQECYTPLTYFCNKYLNDIDEAKDIAQECFLKLYQSKLPISNRKIVKSYLYKTAKNYCLNSIRHNRMIEDYRLMSKEDEVYFFENSLMEAEFSAEINSAIELLPEKRKAVIKQYLRGMTYDDIAVSLNVSLETVKTHLKLGVKDLRETLRKKIL